MFRFCLFIFFIYWNPLFLQFVQASNCSRAVSESQKIRVISHSYNNALVVGSGSFGTALSFVLSQKFKNVFITSRQKKVVDDINSSHDNGSVFHNSLPKNVRAVSLNNGYSDPVLENKDWGIVIFALPLPSLNEVLTKHKRFFSSLVEKNIPFVSLSKGIEADSLKLSDDIFLDIWPGLAENLIVLSGPSFAREIMEKQPTFVTLAGKNRAQLIQVYNMLSTADLKISLSRDVKGVLVGGAVKNVIAIAIGVAEGLGASANTRAGLVTLLFNEFARFSLSYGAKPQTLYDFSGLGDIYLSLEGTASRNKQFGLIVGQGQSFEAFLKGNTVEGYHTVFSLNQIIEKENMNLPLFRALFRILYEKADPNLLIQNLKEKDIISFSI